MSLVSRILNVFRGDRMNREIDEELESHIEEALAAGRDPAEVRRSFGNSLKLREDSRDVRIAARLDSIRADFVFGMRQLIKNKMTAGAAIVSLALAIGACTSAFRLIDALLLRPLPVASPERLYVLAYELKDPDGKPGQGDSFDYPSFRILRAAAQGDAELMAISYPRRSDVSFSPDQEPEHVRVQYISGWTFGAFGLKPALGRLLTESDDLKPGAHPYAVLSYDYWNSRLGRDPKVVGRSFRMGKDSVQIIGVAPKGFTGTDPGTVTDMFVPMMMNANAIENPNWGWFRVWVQTRPETHAQQLHDKLQAAFRHIRTERSRESESRMSAERLNAFRNAAVSLEPAAAGFSGLQKNYRRSLWILGAMVALVLLIACVNVANLMMAQGAARAREMALRVSIGAGRARLVQLMLAESALIAAISSVLGGLFAWWAAPFVVGLISAPDDPTRLVLPADWRVMGFAVALALAVTLLFGIVPALRASSVKPAAALRGGEEVGTRHRIMNTLVVAQVAFCFVVHFVAGMFVASFERLSHQPLGFSASNVLAIEAVAQKEQPIEFWYQAKEHFGTLPGVESASLCLWPLLGHSIWTTNIAIDGRQMHSQTPYLLSVSHEWLDTMRIPLLAGRGFRPSDASPSVAIVTESFARTYLDGQSPVGRRFEREMAKGKRVSTTIIGVVGDVRYADMRESIRPVIFLPGKPESTDAGGMYPKDWGTFMVRTSGDPAAVAATLREELRRVRPEFRVMSIRTQQDIVNSHTVRERLLATLSLFFGTVALILAGVGLYGVLNYSVLQRTREIGIRVALGARPAHVARRIAVQLFGTLLAGSAAGLALGMASESYIETLLFQVTARQFSIIAIPTITILAVALLAAIPPLVRAIRIDPALALRSE